MLALTFDMLGSLVVLGLGDQPTIHQLSTPEMLVFVGMIASLISSIYFIVRAFQVSTGWGLFVLLLPGLGTLFFILFHFQRAVAPLFWVILGAVFIATGMLLRSAF